MNTTQRQCPAEFRYRSYADERPVNGDSADIVDESNRQWAIGLRIDEPAWVQHRDGLFYWDGKLWLSGFTCTQPWQDDHFSMHIQRTEHGIAVLEWDKECLLGPDHGDGDRRGSLPEHKPNLYRNYAHDLWVVATPST